MDETEQAAAAVATQARGPQPELIEGPGRYAVYKAPDGGMVIARAVELCETCRHCGCGEQAEPVQIPAMIVSLAMSQGKGKILGMLKGLKRGG